MRIPQKYKNRVRRSAKNTFIYSGKHALSSNENTKLAIRVVKPHRLLEASHADFLRFFPFLYSSSANAHHQMFHLDFALQKVDMVVLDKRGLAESQPSKIYKISNFNLKCIR